MINEYIDCTEFMRLIEDQKIKPSVVRSYLKEQGMIFTSSNAHELATSIYTIFLGCHDMDKLKEIITHDSNYEKSVLVNSELSESIQGDILIYFADELNKIRTNNFKDMTIEQPIISEDSMLLQMSYKKKVPGKNRFLKDETRSVKIQIRRKNQHAATIDIRQQSSTDYQRFLDLLSEIATAQEDVLSIKHVDLQVLQPQNRVAFFDELATMQYNNWRLKTITGITVKKISALEEDDEEELDARDQETPTGALAGINQAVLNGNGLRSNEFVQTCLSQGFEISSMKYRYESKQEPIEFAVSVSSKNEDLRIDIDKSYIEEDGRIYCQPLSKADQDEIIRAIQEAANTVYNSLCNVQKVNSPVKGVVVSVVP